MDNPKLHDIQVIIWQ